MTYLNDPNYKAIIAVFCKDKKTAEELRKKKEKQTKHDYCIIEATNGYLVVAKKQLE